MAVRVEVNPELLIWARERSGLELDDLVRRYPKLPQWEAGALSPTLKQLESYAQTTHAPVGYLLLPEPPQEELPIPDFRTMRGEQIRRPSPDLLETIFQCEQRQEWYRDFARAAGDDPLPFVESLTTGTPIVEAAALMRESLGFEVADRGASWSDALRVLIDAAEAIGVLVMVNGIVGSNTHRKLDPDEFRGFALVDRYAPVVFVNGADTKAAQIFTLAHELAHLYLGQSALSDATMTTVPMEEAELWCNQVAAEFLLPLDAVRDGFIAEQPLRDELDRFARAYKVSTLVVLRRIFDAGRMELDAYRTAYRAELQRLLRLSEERGDAGGGNFFNTQPLRVSRRFARAVIGSTLEGQTLYREAFQMLGFRKVSTFHELASRLRGR